MSIKKSETGFTLVELLVSIIVSVIMVGSLSVAVTNHTHLQQRGRDVTVLNSYAENKFEELRSLGYGGLSDGSTSIASELPSEIAAPRSGTVTISTYSTGVKKLVLTVTYNDQGSNRTYSYSSLVSELGVGQY